MTGDTGPAGDPGVQRWSGAAGVTASGVLPVAVLAVRVRHAADGEQGPVGRTATRQHQAVIELLVARLRPGDRASKIGEDDLRRALEWAITRNAPVVTIDG
ncbi:hypothetical protein GCM10010435_60490 [Winogradskya consettensis]|uniref:Uncharacterized protein n=1 Tax=Winogradskya consettensis TaxID=113560 RepID=A0A919SQ70_9ACTN|nr:hypothetical protein [Actinoplanes consettensis]GIM76366.1 hypothetical protein Aco04nite_50070 [Actinoplanes consettensis]